MNFRTDQQQGCLIEALKALGRAHEYMSYVSDQYATTILHDIRQLESSVLMVLGQTEFDVAAPNATKELDEEVLEFLEQFRPENFRP